MEAVLADLKEWLQDRKQHLDLFDETKTARLDNPLYALGGLVWLSWMIVIVSGVILMLWYIPTTTGAYRSILHITYDIPLGWLARGMHKYGADMLITVITLRIYRMYFAGEYKKPGELSWMILFASLVLGMISGITGYLLIWNQRAFWAAKTVLTVPTYYDEIPLVKDTGLGHAIAYIFLGGPAVAQAAITRFYAIHLGISVPDAPPAAQPLAVHRGPRHRLHDVAEFQPADGDGPVGEPEPHAAADPLGLVLPGPLPAREVHAPAVGGDRPGAPDRVRDGPALPRPHEGDPAP